MQTLGYLALVIATGIAVGLLASWYVGSAFGLFIGFIAAMVVMIMLEDPVS